MKIYNKLLALCVVCPTIAFVVPAHKVVKSKGSKLYSSLARSTRYAGPRVGTAWGNDGILDRKRGPQLNRERALTRPPPIKPGYTNDIWDSMPPVIVQGNSLRTWSIKNLYVDRVQVYLRTEGRPLNANVELWQGPDNTPFKMTVYNEDGNLRPFSAVIETPRSGNSIAIRNTGNLEFPFDAVVDAELAGENRLLTRSLYDMATVKTIQGGALKTYPFAPSVASVQVYLETDGRPLNARIELLQGPNNDKQVIDVYAEDGLERPFFAVIETPGTGNVVRIVNTATVEFPMIAAVEPYAVDPYGGDDTYSSGSYGSESYGRSPFVVS